MSQIIKSFLLFFEKKEKLSIFLVVAITSAFFFNQMFLKGYVPFPGDLLVGQYNPYNSYSFLGYSPGGYPNKAQDFDVLELLYPSKYFSIEQFKNGEIPLWNPYNFSGTPHLASLQSGTFYPLNIIFFLFPFIFAWGFYIFLQPVLAGFFTYLLLREFKLTKNSSIFGGLVFAFSSYFIVWMEYGNIGHSIVWLPIVMLMSLKNIKKPTLEKSILIIFLLTFSILAGYIQTSFYLFILLFVFILFNICLEKENKIKKLILFVPIFVLPVLLSSVQLFPMFELFKNSSRTSFSSMINPLIPELHIITLFVPDFFGNPATRNYWLSGTYIERVSYLGVLPLFFIAYSLWQKRNYNILFFALIILSVYLFTFDTIFARLFYSLNLPFISTAVPSRDMFIFTFSGSILAAFGLDNFIKIKNLNKSFYLSVFIIGVIYVLLWIFIFLAPSIFSDKTWVVNLSISKRNLIISSFIFMISIFFLFLFLKLFKFRKYIIIALLFITIFDLYYFFQKITPFSPVESVYPKTEVFNFLRSRQGIDRVWGYGSAYIESNIQIVERIYSTDGYDALHLKRYGELVSASKNGKIPGKIARSEGELAQGYGQDDLRQNIYRQRALNLLGVKYILHKNDNKNPDYQIFDESIYKLIWNKGSWQIYENKEALSRVFLAGEYVVEKDKDRIIKNIYDPKFNLNEKIILEENISDSFNLKKDEKASVKIISYLPNKIILSTKSSKDNILFISDNYFNGWKASVDGQDQKIYRADYSFRAVPVKKGNHEIIMWYYPDSFDLGMKISITTLIGLLVFFLLSRFKVLFSAK